MFRSVILSTTALFIAVPALAVPSYNRPHIVITPTKTPIEKDKVGSAVTVISEEDIKKSNETQVVDILKNTPGVSLSRSGPSGGVTNIRIRGSNPGQVRVLIDGVFMGDPSNVNTDFNFNSLLVEDIERIEVLRGPQSALYGSDAMGGVINIITKKGKQGPPQFSGLFEAGSYGTFREAAGVRGATDRWNYSLQLQHAQSNGFSSSASGPEEDGYRDRAITAHLAYQLNDIIRLEGNARYNQLDADFDPGATTDGPAETESKQAIGRVAAIASTLNDTWEHILSYQLSRIERENDEPTSAFNRFSSFDGTANTVEYQSNLSLRKRDIFTAALVSEKQQGKATRTSSAGVLTGTLDDDFRINSAYVQYLWGMTDTTTLTVGGRFDDHSNFGSATTYRAAISQEFPETNTILRASLGTGFKTPTLTQLFGPFGANPNLQPEESIGYDAGVEQKFLGGRLHVETTLFRNEYSDLIDYTSMFVNVNKAVTQGVEFFSQYYLTPEWNINTTYTYLLSEDETTNKVLPRRPKHSLIIGTDYSVADVGNIGFDVRYVSRQLDSNFASGRTKPFTTVDIHASRKITDHAEIYGRIENLFDKDYQEVLNYNASGLAIYVGTRLNY